MIVQIISLILVQIPGATEMIPNPISNELEPQLIGTYAIIETVIALIGSIGTAWL